MTTLASGVDGSVRALGYTYNALGLPYQQTSYSDPLGASVVNQVQDNYNGYGQLITQYQEHSGVVNTGSSLKVQYSYSQPSSTNYSRLSSMTYPNGRILDYVYASGLDSDVSRISALSDDGGSAAGTDETYTYLGLNTVIQELDANGVELTYIHQAGDTLSSADGGDRYTGLDRFGRIIDQWWYNPSGPTTTDRFQYGYDRDGNVLYKNNLVSSSFSELYHANSSSSGDNNSAYDSLNRLTGFRRGTLSSSGHNGPPLDTVSTLNSTLSANKSQSFTLDAVGNQTSVTTDGTAVSRTVDSQNELTAVGATSLAFDNNGNTTTDDQGHTLIYDAWNRLVQVKNGGTTLATYAFDATGWRIGENPGTASDLYFSSTGQALEERQSSTVTNQYVWRIGYINDLLLRDDNSTTGSLGITSSGLGRRILYQHDMNYNVTALSSTGGSVLQRYVYTPYGVAAVLTAAWGNSSDAYGNGYMFQAGRYDPASNLTLFRFREYSSESGRWYQKDALPESAPVAFSMSRNIGLNKNRVPVWPYSLLSALMPVDRNNLYGFERNGPVNSTDSLGLCPFLPNSQQEWNMLQWYWDLRNGGDLSGAAKVLAAIAAARGVSAAELGIPSLTVLEGIGMTGITGSGLTGAGFSGAGLAGGAVVGGAAAAGGALGAGVYYSGLGGYIGTDWLGNHLADWWTGGPASGYMLPPTRIPPRRPAPPTPCGCPTTGR